MGMHFLSGSALSKVVVVIATISGALPALAGGEMHMAAPPVGARQAIMSGCQPDTTQYREGGDGPVRCVAKPPCAPELTRDALGDCHCPPDTTEVRNGNGLPSQYIAKPACAPGQSRDVQGDCHCPPGTAEVRSGNGNSLRCQGGVPVPCGAGKTSDCGWQFPLPPTKTKN